MPATRSAGAAAWRRLRQLLFALLLLNLLCAVILDVQHDVKWFFKTDARVALPNYPDKPAAKRLFAEQHALERRFVPFVVWSRRPFEGRSIRIDASGDRIHPPTTDTPVGTVRFLGGSTTWGTGADDANTLPARFNALNPDFRVLNHGETSFTSRQELARLVNLVNTGQEMDLVVLYSGHNEGELCRSDVGLNETNRDATLERGWHPPSLAVEMLTGGIRGVLEGKFFQRRVFRTPPETILCVEDPGHVARLARWTFTNWRIAREVARIGGAEFLVVLQPTIEVGSPRIDHLPEDDVEAHPYVGRIYAELKRIIDAERPDWLLDFTDAFDVEEPVYIDHVHVSANGNAIVARRLSSATQPLLDRVRRTRSGRSG